MWNRPARTCVFSASVPIGACTDRPDRTCTVRDRAACGPVVPKGGRGMGKERDWDDLLQPERLDAVVVLRGVLRVYAVGQRLDEAQERRVRAHVGRAVRG